MKHLCNFVLFGMFLVGCSGEPRANRSGVDFGILDVPEAVSTALKGEYELELYSLSPKHLDEKPDDDFHGWEVLGSANLDADKGTKIIEGFKSGLASAPDYVAGCFNPRHGLRISSAEQVVDLVICFQCVQVYVFVGEERIANLKTSSSPRQLFDKIVADLRLPMPAPADE